MARPASEAWLALRYETFIFDFTLSLHILRVCLVVPESLDPLAQRARTVLCARSTARLANAASRASPVLRVTQVSYGI